MNLTEYTVDFDMKYSHSFTVKAKSKGEAKRKAFIKFNTIRNKISQYNVWVNKA